MLCQAPRHSDLALGKTIGTQYPVDVDKALRTIGSAKLQGIANHQDYIRQAVEDRLRADGKL